MSWLVRTIVICAGILVLLLSKGETVHAMALSAEDEAQFLDQVDSENLEAGEELTDENADFDSQLAETPEIQQPGRGRGPASVSGRAAQSAPPVRFQVSKPEAKSNFAVAPDQGFQKRRPNIAPAAHKRAPSENPALSCDTLRKNRAYNSRYWHPACLRKSKPKLVDTTAGHPDVSPSEYYKRLGKEKGEKFNIKLRQVASSKTAAQKRSLSANKPAATLKVQPPPTKKNDNKKVVAMAGKPTKANASTKPAVKAKSAPTKKSKPIATAKKSKPVRVAATKK